MTDFNREKFEGKPVQFYDSNGEKIEGAIYDPTRLGSLEKTNEIVQRAIIDSRLSPGRIMQNIEYFRNKGIEPSSKQFDDYLKIEDELIEVDEERITDPTLRFIRDIEAGRAL